VKVVVDAIADAVARGVDVRLLRETAEAGVLDVDAADAFEAVRGSVGIYIWPIDHRLTAHGQPGNLHAKAIICDESAALVTSANLTGFAMEINMELGILVEGGPVPKRLAQHLDELMAHGVLRRLS
jgi:phosphatidylserine/phosphatidylglycerophosphate/cardiolipin synthase-like enzyme